MEKAIILGIGLLGAAACSVALLISPLAAMIPPGALLFWIGRRHPGTALVAAVALFPLQRSLLGMPAYAASAAATGLTAAAFVATRRVSTVLPSWKKNASQYLAICLIGYTLLSLYVRASVEQGGILLPAIMETEGPTFYKYIIQALILFLLVSRLARSWSMLRTVTWIHLAVLGLLSIVGLEQALTGENGLLRTYWGSKESLSLLGPDFSVMTSIFFDQNHFSNFLVSTTFVCIPVVFGARERLWLKIAASPILAMAFLCVLLAQSVGNWLAFCVGGATWLLLRRRGKVLFLMVTSVMLFMLLFANFGVPELELMTPETRAKIEAVLRLDFGKDSPNHIRLDLIQAGIEMFASHPVFGVGYGGYQPSVASHSYFMERTKEIVYSHNSYILVLAEQGIVGFLLLVAFLWSCIARGSRALANAPTTDLKARQAGLLAAIMANLVFLGSYDPILYSLCLWIPLGLTVGLARMVKDGSGDLIGPDNWEGNR